jgi:hypothetical protein
MILTILTISTIFTTLRMFTILKTLTILTILPTLTILKILTDLLLFRKQPTAILKLVSKIFCAVQESGINQSCCN